MLEGGPHLQFQQSQMDQGDGMDPDSRCEENQLGFQRWVVPLVVGSLDDHMEEAVLELVHEALVHQGLLVVEAVAEARLQELGAHS